MSKPNEVSRMTAQQAKRLEELTHGGGFIGYETFEAIYGPGTLSNEFLGRLRSHYSGRGLYSERPGKVHRFRVETFFQRSGLMPIRWAAPHLGMTVHSFSVVVDGLIDRGVCGAFDIFILPNLVLESFVRDFKKLFYGTRDRTFFGKDDYFPALHKTIQKELGLKVDKLYCSTSITLGKKKYADRYDIITDFPLASEYTVWCDFGKTNNFSKPANLRPDECSALLVHQEQKLRKYLCDGYEASVEQINTELNGVSRRKPK